MSLRNAEAIDLITGPFDGDDCDLVLFIVDTEEHDDELERFELLVEKLTAYVSYAWAPDFAKEHPDVDPHRVLIRVLSATPPNSAMQQVQKVGPKGEDEKRLPVVFSDYDTFLSSMRPDDAAQ